MLYFEPLHAYALCGASSLVAAGMLSLADVPDADIREVRRYCVAAFLVIGVGFFQLTFGTLDPPEWAVYGFASAATVGTALLVQGMALMLGKPLRRSLFFPLLVGLALVVALAQWNGRITLVLTVAVFSVVAPTALVVAVPRLMTRSASLPEQALGLAVLVYAASWVVRGVGTVRYEGPLYAHLMYVSPAWATWLSIVYCVMPVLLGSLVLNTVNARIARRLRAAALTDELTGAWSRRALHEMAPAMAASAIRQGHGVAVVMIDLDHFKAVNDQHGHATGDMALCAAAMACRASLRAESIFTRYGGEEFVALMPVDDAAGAVLAAERVRRSIAETSVDAPRGLAISLTASIGVALWPLNEALDLALRRADAALYRAKAEGRNRVCEWEPTPDEGPRKEQAATPTPHSSGDMPSQRR